MTGLFIYSVTMKYFDFPFKFYSPSSCTLFQSSYQPPAWSSLTMVAPWERQPVSNIRSWKQKTLIKKGQVNTFFKICQFFQIYFGEFVVIFCKKCFWERHQTDFVKQLYTKKKQSTAHSVTMYSLIILNLKTPVGNLILRVLVPSLSNREHKCYYI